MTTAGADPVPAIEDCAAEFDGGSAVEEADTIMFGKTPVDAAALETSSGFTDRMRGESLEVDAAGALG